MRKPNLWGEIVEGKNCRFGAFCDIGNVTFGDNCKIQTHVSIPSGWIIGNNVFIGPGARFANDKHPVIGTEWHPEKGIVEDGASIGMGALIGAGVSIGANAVIGMGAVVTHDVPAGETWYGNPARKV